MWDITLDRDTQQTNLVITPRDQPTITVDNLEVAQFVYLLMGADERKMGRAKEGMLALSKGWEKAQVEELVRDVLVNLIDPYVYQEALDLMALHQALGRRVFIVSSSPEEVVKPLAEHFQVSDVIATRAASPGVV